MSVEKPDYITVKCHKSIYFAVLFRFNEMLGYYNIVTTGIGKHDNKDDAIAEAEWWSEHARIKYIEDV